MKFSMPPLTEALTEWRMSPAPVARAEADNLLFETRVGAARQVFFEDYAKAVDGAEALRLRHVAYRREHVEVIDVPHTFRRALQPAELTAYDDHQPIVRLEGLSRPLQAIGWTFDQLRQADDEKNHAMLDKFLAVWDDSRDARPSFGGFAAELADEIKAADWPCRLRDRLGLAHYNARTGPIPVALMIYPMRDVVAALKDPTTACAFTVPTVLDSEPWPYFFPAPAGLPYGRAMPLAPIDDENLLLAEILHCRLRYRRDHLSKIGQIVTPLVDPDIRALRNHHLMALRLAADDETFGEEIP
jgi:hypothetical protein